MQKVNPKLTAIAYFIIGLLVFYILFLDKPITNEDDRIIIFNQHPNGEEIKYALGLNSYIGFEMIPFNMLNKPLSATHLHRSINEFDKYAVYFGDDTDGALTTGFILSVSDCLSSPSIYHSLVNQIPISFTASCDDKRADLQFVTPTIPNDNQLLLNMFESHTFIDYQPKSSSDFTIRFSMDGFTQAMHSEFSDD